MRVTARVRVKARVRVRVNPPICRLFCHSEGNSEFRAKGPSDHYLMPGRYISCDSRLSQASMPHSYWVRVSVGVRVRVRVRLMLG